MKKLITSLAALLLFAGISHATENKETSVEKKKATESSSTLLSARTISQIIEENAELKIKVEALTSEADNMQSMLDYSKMMHATINNLNGEILKEKDENTKNQLDYARMMNTTLVNLNTVALTGN